MLTLEIRNIHTENNIADYYYEIHINDKMIYRGIYRGHNRKDGWAKLVQNIARLHLKEKLAKEGR